MKISMQNQTSQSNHPALFRFAASLDMPDFSQVLKPEPFATHSVFSTAKSGAKKLMAMVNSKKTMSKVRQHQEH